MSARRYPHLVAVGAVVVATLVRLRLNPVLEERLPFITYFAAVALAGRPYSGWVLGPSARRTSR